MIEFRGVGFTYPGGPTALQGISFRIGEGEKVAVLGPNGAGKSTLLAMLDALRFPTRGLYVYEGREITAAALKDRELERRFRREVALLFQDPTVMLFQPTVAEEVLLALRQRRLPDAGERAARWIRRLGLEAHRERFPLGLSGGERRRVCLAALLATEPRVLLADEPVRDLDPASAHDLVEVLRDLPFTLVVATHDLQLAGALADRALLLSADHRLVYDGPLADLLARQDLLREARLVPGARGGTRRAV
jgi:cobalt/nickel transport system ATP-binding protein